jgi:hypothetical protein
MFGFSVTGRLGNLVPAAYKGLMSRDHPNEPGRWSRLDQAGATTLWRRVRDDPFPVTQYYLVAAGRQAEVLYDEDRARERLAALAPARADAGGAKAG